jgi:nicotinamidase-related amidase
MGSDRDIVIFADNVDILVGGMRDDIDLGIAEEKVRHDIAHRKLHGCHGRRAAQENAALVLVDHQVGLMTGVRDITTGELKHNVVGLAKAAKLHNLPIIVTTTARDSMWGPTFPELVEALPGVDIIDRGTVNAFDDARVSRAIEATGRKKLIFAGISLEICAAFPAITAVGQGMDAYVAVDACGTFSQTKREVGLLRMLQVGVIIADYASLMVEILKDNACPDAGAIYAAIGRSS